MAQLIRILLVLAGVWLAVYLLYRAYTRHRNLRSGTPERIARMLPCTYCGVYVPESQALIVGEKVYCCEEHRQADGV